MMGSGQTQIRHLVEDNPELNLYYENYLHCRSTQLTIFRKPADKKGNEKIVTVLWPTGYSFPKAGGLDRQSYIEMRLFAACLRGEQRAVGRLMSR